MRARQRRKFAKKRAYEKLKQLIHYIISKADICADVGLCRFYNFSRGEHGVPFPLCAAHAAAAVVPSVCVLEKIAGCAAGSCEDCLNDIADEEEVPDADA